MSYNFDNKNFSDSYNNKFASSLTVAVVYQINRFFKSNNLPLIVRFCVFQGPFEIKFKLQSESKNFSSNKQMLVS